MNREQFKSLKVGDVVRNQQGVKATITKIEEDWEEKGTWWAELNNGTNIRISDPLHLIELVSAS